jgi:hypothetical protein
MDNAPRSSRVIRPRIEDKFASFATDVAVPWKILTVANYTVQRLTTHYCFPDVAIAEGNPLREIVKYTKRASRGSPLQANVAASQPDRGVWF